MNERVIIGSARRDENGRYSGGRAGDQDKIEVSEQKFYVHSKGWNILRAKDKNLRSKLAERMRRACNNDNIGYSQSDRLGVIKKGIDTKTPCNADCSSLVRECVKEASGKDPGNFTTLNAVTVLTKTGLFNAVKAYTNTIELYEGDILCTKIKGHIVIVTSSPYNESSAINYIHTNTSIPSVSVKRGSNGDHVRWVQEKLNKKGYGLYVDGIAGIKTIDAIKDFQKKNGLKVDGIAGKETYLKLI